ncbi:MAG: hypothetical protein GC165_18460 [Armatimonadetes bacterium]|nr:hypothetical protein [Armatimonadota bacterium]
MSKSKFILWIELAHFYVRNENPNLPEVIVRDDVVLDTNDLAKDRGVTIGMPVKQAKAILKEGVFLPWESERYASKQSAWMDECIAFSDVIEPADQHALWIDLSQHPEPFEVAETLIRHLSHQTDHVVLSGIAQAKWIARLAARCGTGPSPLTDPKGFLSELSVHHLVPAALEHRQRLHFLGYAKIGRVAAIPFDVLQEQFGEDAYQIARAAEGTLSDEVEASYPPKSCLAKFTFEGVADTEEVLQNGLAKLAQELGDRLDRQSQQGNAMTATLEFEEKPPLTLQRTFSKPYQDARSVYICLNLLLGDALETPITVVHAALTELCKTGAVQESFLDAASSRLPRKFESSLRRIRAVFGDRSVQRGQEIQLPRRVRVLREWKHATGWR